MASRHRVVSGCPFAGQADEGGIEIGLEEDALGAATPAESTDALTLGALVRGTRALHRVVGVADKCLDDKNLAFSASKTDSASGSNMRRTAPFRHPPPFVLTNLRPC